MKTIPWLLGVSVAVVALGGCRTPSAGHSSSRSSGVSDAWQNASVRCVSTTKTLARTALPKSKSPLPAVVTVSHEQEAKETSDDSEESSQVQQCGLVEVDGVAVQNIATSDAPANEPTAELLDQPLVAINVPTTAETAIAETVCQPLSIDLPAALQLAGASNWSIKLARERTREARTRYEAARIMWLPSISFGIGYNGHEGTIQATNGDVQNVSRHSLFAGGGAGIGNSPITGGAGGPFRMGIDLSLADAIFEPLARCQQVKIRQAQAESAFNDTLMQTGIAYFELVRAEAAVMVAEQNLSDAKELVNTTQKFVDAGEGTAADALRARVIEQSRQQQVTAAIGKQAQASTRLAQLLQLDPSRVDACCGLSVVDKSPYPIDLVGGESDLCSFIAQANASRPELSRFAAQVGLAQSQLEQETWRSTLPNVFVGGSAGGFGGGEGTDFPDFDGRADLDVIVAWQVRNLGLGEKVARQERCSQRRQAKIALAQARDIVAREVTEAYYEVEAFRNQLVLAQQNIDDAQRLLTANIELIQELEGMPLELIQAFGSTADARETYLDTVIGYNQAQLKLLRAIGGQGESVPLSECSSCQR